MQSSSEFQLAYKALNPQQKQAVDTIDGPVMVLAGPGTGKTQVLAMRIANILLKTDTGPHAILALTFTESAAKNMRERLVQLIGPTAYSVHVQTFHAFCDEVIRSCPEYFPVRQESEVLSDLERYEILETLLQQTPLKVLKTINSPFHFLKPIMKAISDLKREGINQTEFVQLVTEQAALFEQESVDLKKTELSRRQKNLAKQQELATMYAAYQQQLQQRRRYDYDDMITFVAEAFAKEESLLLEYQEKISYFLVDEYQDTNAAQNKVVDLLASYWGEQANLFVVGDPHQSIYRFQGASLENTLNFVNRYPTAQLISLKIGYRCPQVIYDAAAEVIGQNQNTLHLNQVHSVATELQSEAQKQAAQKFIIDQVNEGLQRPLKATNPDGAKIAVYAAPSDSAEVVFLAEAVQKLLAQKVPAEEIAILYRNNADAIDLQNALEKWQIPYVIDAGNDVLQSPEIIQLLTLCQVVADVRRSQESTALFTVMNYEWLHLSHFLVMKLARAAGKTQMSLYDRVTKGYVEFSHLPFCEDVSALEFSILEDFVDKLGRWGQEEAQLTFPEWLQMVMNESGYLDWILTQPNKMIVLQQMNALLKEIRALAMHSVGFNLERFLAVLATMREHNLAIAAEEVQLSGQAVTLSTVHKAKGREWEYVFLSKCIDGKWGNARQVDLLPLPEGILKHQLPVGDVNEDERRLFYVALTRAKKHFTVTYPETVIANNRPKMTMGSMFLAEIGSAKKDLLKQVWSEVETEKLLARLLTVNSNAQTKVLQQQEKEWLKKVVADYKLSVTALNAYLRSPQDFFEQYILKVPQAVPAYLGYGTAVHATLEFYYRSFLENQKHPSLKETLKKFAQVLQQQVITKEEYPLRLARGQEVLTQYFAGHAEDTPQPYLIEKFFGSGWSKSMLGNIPLVGRIDRIDWIDKAQQTVRVVDYKTGRAQTDNEITGLTNTTEFSERELNLSENIRGPLKRQLLFYKLLTQLDTTFSATVNEGIFDFIEPNRDGKLIRRHLTLDDDDVQALKDLIVDVMKDIRELKF